MTASTVIHEIKNRQTGSLIKIVQITNPKDGYGWAAQCEHGAQLKTNTRRQAHEAGRTPEEWCTTCKKDAKPAAKKATPAPAKRAPAKKVTVTKKATPAKRTAAAKKVAAK
jgi:hypothetical protein